MLYDEALSELALALADASDEPVTGASVHLQLADVTMTIWRAEESRAHLEAAIALGERAGAADLVTGALSETGFLDSMCGLGVTESALRAYERWDGTFVRANAYSPRLALGCADARRRVRRRRALLRDEIAAADEQGLETVEVLARSHLAEVGSGPATGRPRSPMPDSPTSTRARPRTRRRAWPRPFRWRTCRRSSATTTARGRSR